MSEVSTGGNSIPLVARLVAEFGQPLTHETDASTYDYYIDAMPHTPERQPAADGTIDTTPITIGRTAEAAVYFPGNRRIIAHASLLNEAGGLMNAYFEDRNIREVGILDVRAEAFHHHKTRSQKVGRRVLGTYLDMFVNILDSGGLYANTLSIGNACDLCRGPVDATAELRVLGSLGLSRFASEYKDSVDAMTRGEQRNVKFGTGDIFTAEESIRIVNYIGAVFRQHQRDTA